MVNKPAQKIITKRIIKKTIQMILLVLIISGVSIKSFELELKLDHEYNMQIYKKTNFDRENSYLKNSMFYYDESQLCQSSWTTGCPFNKFYYETRSNNKTVFNVHFIVVPGFEEIAKEKNNLTVIENQSLKNKNEDFYHNDYFKIDRITNNLETIKAGYNIHLDSTREYILEYSEEQDKYSFKGLMVKNSTSISYEFHNFTDVDEISSLKGYKKESLNTQTDYENLITTLKNKLAIYYQKEINKDKINKQIFIESNKTLNYLTTSNLKISKIYEKTYSLILYHYCFCDKKTSFLEYLKTYDPNTSEEGNKFNEITNMKDSNISPRWSNFQIEFSYKFFNSLKKNFEYNTENISFLKICEDESVFLVFIPAALLIFLATLITFYSTNNKITNPILKEMKKEVVDEIKWWHGFFFLIISSIFLIFIFYFMKYISFIYTIIIAFYSLTCSFWTLNYIFKSKFIKTPDENVELKTLIADSDRNFIHQNVDAYDNLDRKSKNKKVNSCVCDSNVNNSNDKSAFKNSNQHNNENYKAIDKKSENQFDPEFIIKEKKSENKYNLGIEKNNNDFFEGSEAKNDNNKSFLENEYDIELQEGTNNNYNNNNNKHSKKLNNCEKCCSTANKINKGRDSNSDPLRSNEANNINFTMNPIYNYRNNKILVLLNKKILSFETTKNTASHFYCEIKLRVYEALNLVLVLSLIYEWLLNRNWILNNFFAFSLCFVMLSFLTIRNFKICMVILSCVFFYDVFWVFFSKPIFKKNVMVEVAISLNIPIKLEFPRFFSYNPLNHCMILGLGDIILPGIIIKYCKNFDYLKYHNNIKEHLNYYSLSLKLYVASLILAFMANFIFAHAQPVLFYIAPIFIIGLIANAIKNEELKDFLNGENYKITQMCVDEIINTEFSKFEEGEIQQKEVKKGNAELSLRDASNVNSTNANSRFSTKQNKNFIVLDEL